MYRQRRMGGEGEERWGVEEVVVVILSGHAGWGGGGALKSSFLFLTSIFDPC